MESMEFQRKKIHGILEGPELSFSWLLLYNNLILILCHPVEKSQPRQASSALSHKIQKDMVATEMRVNGKEISAAFVLTKLDMKFVHLRPFQM